MNIFMTSECPVQSAYDHCYVHCVKQILESQQMLSTAHRVLDGDEWADKVGLYKKTHFNHPCSVFVRESEESYNWLLLHAIALHEYYEEKTGKIHASKRLLPHLEHLPKNTPNGVFNPRIAAPEEFQSMSVTHGIPVAYREYLKSKFAEWQSREKPIKVEWPINNKPEWL